MSTQVLTGYFAQAADFTLYANNTGQNVRVIFNYLSIEGTGTNEVRIVTPAQTNQTPSFDSLGNAITVDTIIPASYVQLPNLPDTDRDWIEGMIGRNLSSSSINYGYHYRRYWRFSHPGWGFRDMGGDNPNGFMFLTSNADLSGSEYRWYSYDYNWWRKYGRVMEIPFPTEYYLKPNQSIVFISRKRAANSERKGSQISIKPQQITYNVLVMPEGGC
jgi:hypothetical protein